MNYQNFKIRASASGKIMTSPRSKTELISETTKTYVKEWLTEQVYGIKKEIKSKYLTKGLQLEDVAIDKTIEWLDLPFAIKNEKTFEDDFFTGTPDLIVNDTIFDTKCSWDAFSFPLFEKELPTKDYYFQMQVYMHLTGLKKAKVVYVLLNTPESLTYEEKHNYDAMPKEYRIKTFEIEYSEDVIDDLKQRVTNIRNFIKENYGN